MRWTVKQKFRSLEFLELTTATQYIAYEWLNGFDTEVCLLISKEFSTLWFISNKMVSAVIKLLMEIKLLTFIHPNNGEGIFFVEVEEWFKLHFQNVGNTWLGEKDYADVWRAFATKVLLFVLSRGKLLELELFLIDSCFIRVLV